jgi:hypothetical protein
MIVPCKLDDCSPFCSDLPADRAHTRVERQLVPIPLSESAQDQGPANAAHTRFSTTVR